MRVENTWGAQGGGGLRVRALHQLANQSTLQCVHVDIVTRLSSEVLVTYKINMKLSVHLQPKNSYLRIKMQRNKRKLCFKIS